MYARKHHIVHMWLSYIPLLCVSSVDRQPLKVCTCAAMLGWQSYKRYDAEYRGAVEYDGDGVPYGCTLKEYTETPDECQAGGWGFTVIGIIGMFYSFALLATSILGCLTWMKRLEAPPATHGLGPKPDAEVAVRDVLCLITWGRLV